LRNISQATGQLQNFKNSPANHKSSLIRLRNISQATGKLQDFRNSPANHKISLIRLRNISQATGQLQNFRNSTTVPSIRTAPSTSETTSLVVVTASGTAQPTVRAVALGG
jgi:predicted DNA-binding transcriptional regulator AlpA